MRTLKVRSASSSHKTAISAVIVMLLCVATLSILTTGCEGGVGYDGSGYMVEDRHVESAVMVDAQGKPGLPGEPGVISTVTVEKRVEIEVEAEAFDEAMATSEPVAMSEQAESLDASDMGDNVQISYQPQDRIIVRNADMSVESADPSQTISAIGDMATSRGGWVVNSNTIDKGYYNIGVRVPAESLDDVIDEITAIVSKVHSLNSYSTDFTEEYIDLNARRATIQETVDALRLLLQSEEAQNIENLLEVQREITKWQSELEIIDGRVKFITESAAFSRLTVTVNRAPIPMRVDIGEEVRVGLFVNRQYTARFFPPEEFDRFEIMWDFGDGTGVRTVSSAVRTRDEDGLLTVPVLHTYGSEDYSPYVVSVKIRAFSDDEVAEGEASVWAYVSELPRFDVFLSVDPSNVEENQVTTFTATFNHAETLRDVKYEWDFRDGSSVLDGTVPRGVTGTEIEHSFERYRAQTYPVRFEIWGDSDAGEVRETHEIHVWVQSSPEVESPNFDPVGTATVGYNALLIFFSALGTVAIWIGVTSPFWILIAVIIYLVIRLIRRRTWRRRTTSQQASAEATSGEQET